MIRPPRKHLPFNKAPYPDEVLHSWLGRIAAFYGASWEEMREENGYPDVCDYALTDDIMEFLSALTAIDADRIAQLDPARAFPSVPETRFLCHPVTHRIAPDFCTECFRDDVRSGRDAYIRQTWAIAGVGHCHVHERLLDHLCPSCSKEIVPEMRTMADNIVHACCPRCGEDLARPPEILNLPDRAVLLYVLECERRALGSLHSAHNRRYLFRPVADIAFLLFYSRLAPAAKLVKPRLREWGGSPFSSVTRPLRDPRNLYDQSFLFPLATTIAYERSYLLSAAMAAIEGMDIAKKRFHDAPCSLEHLFFTMDEGCREEMICRAGGWPDYLRNEVKRIIRIPLGERGAADGWEHSKARRSVNDGVLPQYPYL